MLKRGIYIVGCKRTPFGSAGGKLRDVGSIELGTIAAKAAIQQSNISAEKIDSVIVGNVNQSSDRFGTFVSRHIGIKAGISLETPCLTVNRLCGSGFQAVINGATEIDREESEIVLAVGTESMSQTPFVVRDMRYGVKFGKTPAFEDLLFSRRETEDDRFETRMGITAENLAVKYNITREQADQFAYTSQQRWLEAHNSGKFTEELVPVPIKVKGKDVLVDVDEHPRPDSNLEKLAKLPAVFKQGGIVTAGNASGVNDGAGALVLVSEDAMKKNSLKGLSRIVAYSIVGCEPSIMGIGPAPAIRKLLQKTNLSMNSIDLFDVNEAFAAQWLAVQKDLGLDLSNSNVNGGAIALGHPLGASGARILTNLTYEMKRRNAKYGIGSACIGGGQGISVLLENIN